MDICSLCWLTDVGMWRYGGAKIQEHGQVFVPRIEVKKQNQHA